MGLGNGISGNAYAFAALYKMTEDRTWLLRFRAFVLFVASRWEELADVPENGLSLYEVRTVHSTLQHSSMSFFGSVLDGDYAM